ncbi:MAG: hypothetical protein KIT87_16665 [Anaerolineae bacterium]|nr:hypothetical protein [Anaerolineae bacterium]
MLAEYDFSKMKNGVRGKYYKARREGYTVKINHEDGAVEYHHYKPLEGTVAIDRDVREYFPDAEAVNNALRGLIALIPKKHEHQPLEETDPAQAEPELVGQ